MVIRRHGLAARLSSEGLRFLPQARALVAAATAAEDSFRSTRGPALRLGATESISASLLPSALAGADGEQGGIADVTIGLCRDLRSMVSAGALDMCFTIEGGMPAPDANAVSRWRGAVALALFGGADAPGGVVEPDVLEGVELLVPDPTGSLTEHLSSWLVTVGVRCRIRSAGSIEGVRAGVRFGSSIGVVPAFARVDRSIGSSAQVMTFTSPPRPMLLIATIGDPEGCDRLADCIAATPSEASALWREISRCLPASVIVSSRPPASTARGARPVRSASARAR